MTRVRFLLCALSVSLLVSIFAWPSVADARGRGGGGHSPVRAGTYHSNSRTSGSVNVRGSVKKNGTYVAPHKRSSPDGNFNNNWSTKGNMNPSTGKEGTRVTPRKVR
jgi:hypothetical protein